MTQPTPYRRGYDFSDAGGALPPGGPLDDELDDVGLTLSQILRNLALIQRDDTALRNGIVGIDALDGRVLGLISGGTFSIGGTWATDTAYPAGAFLTDDGAIYLVMEAHTSTTIVDDLAAGHIAKALQNEQGTRLRDDFVGNAVQTEFSLSQSPARPTDVEVYVDGALVLQDAYVQTGATVTFDVAPANGAEISIFSITWATAPPIQTLVDAVGDRNTEISAATQFLADIGDGAPGKGASLIATEGLGDVQSDLDARPTSAELADPTGASLIGWIRDVTGAIAGTVGDYFDDNWSVMQFIPFIERVKIRLKTSTADLSPYLQAAVDGIISAGGGTLNWPKGTYNYDSSLVVERGSDNVGVIFQGAGRDTILNQRGADEDAITWTQTRFLFNSGIRDMKIVTDADAGHCITIGYGISTNFFCNVELVQGNTGKSLFYGDFSSGGGIYDTKFSGGSWYCAVGASVAGFRVICGGTRFNENIFENLRCYYASGEQFFKITAESGSSYWLVNNRWQNINFEVGVGGGLYLACMRICSLKNISFWDAGGDYTGNLVEFASGTGYESTANCLENVGRHGGALAVGVQDIKITAGQDTVITNCYTQTSDAPFYDFGGKRVTVIGRFVGTITNDTSTRMFSTGSGAIKFPGTVNGTYLNYYDEGTWTATLSGSNSAPTTPVTATGQWTRIGRQVFASVKFSSVDTTGASGSVIVTGLPFSVNASQEPVDAVNMVGMGTTAAIAKVAGTTITLYRLTSATAITHADGTAGAGKSITLSMAYIV